MSVGAIVLKEAAYFGLIEYQNASGKQHRFIVSKNSRQDGYQTIKPLERSMKERAAWMERNGNTILSCLVFQSETVVTAYPSTSYELKP